MAHLQPKKLGRRDREEARLLKKTFLERLAGEAAIGVQPEGIEQLLRDPEASRRAALAAYGHELLRRLEGQAWGASALALWREFAWSPKGSPIKGFKLEARKIKQAEEQVLAELRNNAE